MPLSNACVNQWLPLAAMLQLFFMFPSSVRSVIDPTLKITFVCALGNSIEEKPNQFHIMEVLSLHAANTIHINKEAGKKVRHFRLFTVIGWSGEL